MKLKHLIILLSIICCSQSVFGQKANRQPKTSGNPVFPGWYADPEGVVFGDEYWIYPTYSAPYDEQTFMDAFSSKDLVNWTKHPKVLSKENISWFKRALWAPAVIHANDKYYIFFGANDIQSNNELGGIGVAVADNPAGPFKDALGKPLIDKICKLVRNRSISLFTKMMTGNIICIMVAGDIVIWSNSPRTC